jgi:hypothetical protein
MPAVAGLDAFMPGIFLYFDSDIAAVIDTSQICPGRGLLDYRKFRRQLDGWAEL